MKRLISKELLIWKEKAKRKPLLLEGVRQVGKTYSLKQFGKNEFKNFYHFDLEENQSLNSLFKENISPEQLLQSLSIKVGKKIDPKSELIIFDEIQNTPRALTSLKYIAEKHPDWFIIASGSLLGVGLTDTSFPVGKVERLRMHPMSFLEFLLASKEELLLEAIQEFKLEEKQNELIHKEIWKQLKNYLFVGGLPEAIDIFLQYKNNLPQALQQVRTFQKSLIQDYKDDITKHSGKLKSVKIQAVLESIPVQLARETKGIRKFLFKEVLNRNSKYNELEGPIEWLIRAGLVHKISICEKARLPLKAYSESNRFILYIFDIGILHAMMDISPESIFNYDYGSYKGYVAENFVLQELTCFSGKEIFNWQEGTSQIEFLLNNKGQIFPIEVKAGLNTKAKSLKVFRDKYQPDQSFLFCGRAYDNQKIKPHILPLYVAFKLSEFLDR